MPKRQEIACETMNFITVALKSEVGVAVQKVYKQG